MRTLQFSVDGQKLSKDGDFSGIIRGSKGYLRCRFTFANDDWNDCKVVVVFYGNSEEYAVPLERDRTCGIPNEVTDEKCFKIRIIGVRNREYKVSTNQVLISQEV